MFFPFFPLIGISPYCDCRLIKFQYSIILQSAVRTMELIVNHCGGCVCDEAWHLTPLLSHSHTLLPHTHTHTLTPHIHLRIPSPIPWRPPPAADPAAVTLFILLSSICCLQHSYTLILCTCSIRIFYISTFMQAGLLSSSLRFSTLPPTADKNNDQRKLRTELY